MFSLRKATFLVIRKTGTSWYSKEDWTGLFKWVGARAGLYVNLFCTVESNTYPFYPTLLILIQRLVRVKRKNQTYFIHTKKSNTILSIKEEVSEALSGQVPPLKMRLYSSQTEKTPLPDEATLADHDNLVKDDETSILYLVFRKPGKEDAEGEDQFGLIDDVWEDVEVIEPE